MGGETLRDARTVYLGDGNGPCLRIEVERDNTTPGRVPLEQGGNRYSLKAVGSCGQAQFDLDAVSRRQVDFSTAASYAAAVTGLEVETSAWSGYSHRLLGTAWTDDLVYWHPLGYELSILLRDPNPAQVGGFQVLVNYNFFLDGPSGAINKVTLPPGRSLG
jgi:hypothetical protein